MDTEDLLYGTHEAEIIRGMKDVYAQIDAKQHDWKNAGGPRCIDGCGCCCEDFEPELLEGEALCMAAWFLEHDEKRAGQIAEGTYIPPEGRTEHTCILFNPNNPYHCSAYRGRGLICRLFGYSGEYDKNGHIRFSPCRFYPKEQLSIHNMEHRQYSAQELEQCFGAVPPAMIDCMEQAIALVPGCEHHSLPLREALPQAIRRLSWLIRCMGNDNGGGNAGPQSA